MKCINDQQLFDFINNELPLEEHEHIEFHLGTCKDCREAYSLKLEEVKWVKNSIHEFAFPINQIPEFIFPKEKQTKKTLNISPILLKLSIAATIIILISISILFLDQKKQNKIELQRIQIEQEMLITDMNEAWNERELIITKTDQKTGKSEIFLSSDTEK